MTQTKNQQDELTALKAQLERYQASEKGWLITTPNPAYTDDTAGVFGLSFKDGACFIKETQVIPFFEFKAMNLVQRKRYLSTFQPEQREAAEKSLDERESMTSAQRAVEVLERDFHYTAEYFDGSTPGALAQRLEERKAEAQLARQQSDEAAREKISRISNPDRLLNMIRGQ